jgi:hypothetical protein
MVKKREREREKTPSIFHVPTGFITKHEKEDVSFDISFFCMRRKKKSCFVTCFQTYMRRTVAKEKKINNENKGMYL